MMNNSFKSRHNKLYEIATTISEQNNLDHAKYFCSIGWKNVTHNANVV